MGYFVNQKLRRTSTMIQNLILLYGSPPVCSVLCLVYDKIYNIMHISNMAIKIIYYIAIYMLYLLV